MSGINTDSSVTQFVGSIPEEVFALLGFGTTMEVILTGERLQKNKKHHSELPLEYYQLLTDAIQSPLYVCRNKRDKQTIIFYYGPVEKSRKGDRYLRIAVLLKTDKEPPEYKNSIQSFRYARYKEIEKDIMSERLIWKKE